jgi:hypothetical protein
MGRPVAISLPPADKAAGIREGVRQRAQWQLEELVEGWGLVAPNEGAGAVYPYFKTTKLCDASTTLTGDTFDALARNPGWPREHVPASTAPGMEPTTEWTKALLEWADKVAASGRRAAELAAVSATITALSPEEVPNYLLRQTPRFFENNPDGSLWFFEVDQLFATRTALLRVLLALATMPDFLEAYAGEKGALKIQTLQEHSLTGGIANDALVEALLLAIPPASMGVAWSWMPHAIVFLFGHPTSLLEEHPPTFASLYVPRLHGTGAGFHWRESDFWDGVGPAEVETLFQWWATRLNVIYSHALDPTNFDDGNGLLDVKRQTVWFLTFERLLADALSIGSSPQSAALARLETGFDLLDKAESLLGYTQKNSGKGFERLLRRNEMIPRLDRVWDDRLPLQLRPRFKSHTRHLYDRIYDHIKENAYPFRVADDGSGIKIWSAKHNKLIKWSWDSYVPPLVRAVRNSAHGVMETFEKASERDIVVAHSGEMPPELPELAAFLAFAIVADAERVCAGTWWA